VAALRVQEAAGPLLDALLQEASSRGCTVIARVQDLRRKEIVVANGNVEETRAVFSRGFGMHLFDGDGHTAFSCGDGWGPADGLAAFERAWKGLEGARRAGAETNRAVFEAEPARDLVDPPTRYGFDHEPLRDLARDAVRVHDEIRGRGDGLKVRSMYSVTREEWRVVRSDGTDVAFAVPRSYFSNSLTASGDEGSASAISSVFGNSHELILDEDQVGRSVGKAAHVASILGRVVVADAFPGGSYPIVMDHSLAKVLAHEAFGHAAESDAYRSSVLAREGRFRTGDTVASPGVHLIDESIDGDHAFQPYSANGIRRERAVIIEDGVLKHGLGDLFSAGPGGVPVTGAGRAQSYRDTPLPRMSNIRIELDEPAPLDVGPDEELSPETVREVLIREGFLSEERPRAVYLYGFRGGQVNPVKGDFVFNSQSLFELSLDGVSDFRPAIFSGSVLEALKAIRGGIGSLRLDAMGTCGKGGQGVPSCGGSHRLLCLEASPQIRLGGKA
jgi:TldD protein